MKKLGNGVLIFVIILLIAAVGFGGWYFAKKDKESSEKIAKLENLIAGSNDKKDNDTTKSNKTEEANKAIREALKDENWLGKNISEKDVKLSNGETYPANISVYKMADDEGIPVYIVTTSILDGFSVNIVTYKNDKVVVSKKPVHGEYSFMKVNTKSNQIAIVNDPTNEGEIYQIIGSEFSEIGYNFEPNESESKTGYYELYGKKVSKNEYEKVINEMDMVDVYNSVGNDNNLNSQTIDKIVK